MDGPGQDVRLAGGVSAIQQYLRAGLVVEMHLAYGPLLLGSGERLFDNLVDVPNRYDIAELRVHQPRFTSASCVNPKSP
jgi:dihydrofolate reductase